MVKYLTYRDSTLKEFIHLFIKNIYLAYPMFKVLVIRL